MELQCDWLNGTGYYLYVSAHWYWISWLVLIKYVTVVMKKN